MPSCKRNVGESDAPHMRGSDWLRDGSLGLVLVPAVKVSFVFSPSSSLLHKSRAYHVANMSERKVLTKYYPPEFDPSKIARTPKHLRPTGPKTIPVRLMAPCSMKCTSCGEYIYKGRKF